MSAFPWDKDYVKPAPGRENAIHEIRSAAQAASVAARKSMELRDDARIENRKKKKLPDDFNPEYGPLIFLRDEDLTARDLQMIERFVDAYFETWSTTKAYIAANPGELVTLQACSRAGRELFQSPAVQKRLKAVVDSMEEDQLISRKTVLMGLMREANHFGGDATHGGRIRAWMGLARIKEMDVQVTKTDVNIRGGVMIVPGSPDGQIIDVEAWEKHSEAQQLELKEEVRK